VGTGVEREGPELRRKEGEIVGEYTRDQEQPGEGTKIQEEFKGAPPRSFYCKGGKSYLNIRGGSLK